MTIICAMPETLSPNAQAVLPALQRIRLTDLEESFFERKGIAPHPYDIAQEWEITEGRLRPERAASWVLSARCLHAPHALELGKVMMPSEATELRKMAAMLDESLRARDYHSLEAHAEEGTHPIERAVAWLKHGFSVEDAQEWQTAGAASCLVARHLRRARISPSEAEVKVPTGKHGRQSHARRLCQRWARLDDTVREIHVTRALGGQDSWHHRLDEVQEVFTKCLATQPLTTVEKGWLEKDRLPTDPRGLALAWLHARKEGWPEWTTHEITLFASHHRTFHPYYAERVEQSTESRRCLEFVPGIAALFPADGKFTPQELEEADRISGSKADLNPNPIARAISWVLEGYHSPEEVRRALDAGHATPEAAGESRGIANTAASTGLPTLKSPVEAYLAPADDLPARTSSVL